MSKKKNKKNEAPTITRKQLIGGGVLALIAVVAITAGLILYYGDDIVSARTPESVTPNTAEAVFGVNDEPQPLPSVLEEDFVAATINGINIYASDIRASLSMAEDELMREHRDVMADGWNEESELRAGTTAGRVLREDATRIAAITQIYLNFAEEMGIYVTDAVSAEIAEHIDAIENQFGPEDFEHIMRSERIGGREHLTRIFENNFLMEEVVQTIMADTDLFAPFAPYMEEGEEAKAAELIARALAGEDFGTLVRTYGEDPGMTEYPDGYTFTLGDMVPEFEAATLAMEVGEISDMVHTSFGIHIIKRVEPNPDNIMIGSRFDPSSDDILLGAKHILLMSSPLERRMIDAVHTRFGAMVDDADLVFLPTLDDVPIM